MGILFTRKERIKRAVELQHEARRRYQDSWIIFACGYKVAAGLMQEEAASLYGKAIDVVCGLVNRPDYGDGNDR